MKTKGRAQSGNIEDRRAYFGSASVDPDYPNEDRMADFATQSLLAPYADAGDQPIQKMPKKRVVKAFKVRGVPPG
jgi:hypothetical protein